MFALGFMLILPLFAQESGNPPPEGTNTEITETEQPAETAGSAPVDGTVPVEMEVQEEMGIVEPVPLGPPDAQLPSGYKVGDYPNDGGDAILITWALTEQEKAIRDSEGEFDYTYRIYHTSDPLQIENGNIKPVEEDLEAEIEPNYIEVAPLSSTLVNVRTHFWGSSHDKNFHAYRWELEKLPVLDRKGEPMMDPEGDPITKPDLTTEHFFQLALVDSQGRSAVVGPAQSLKAISNTFNWLMINNLLIGIIFFIIVFYFISQAKKGAKLFIRKIAGLDAVDEAIGRATEMGRPILYLTGLDSLSTVSTIAAVNILGQVARKVADYDSQIIVPNRDPVVMSVCQEVVHEAYMDAGRPDAYNEANIFFITDDQFSYVAAIDGIMVRDKPATNIFMGYYYAEALLLAETGASTGAIQIAGTDALAQLPFFITTCDYTLIGEELYAASAYLAREPLLLGSLKAQDVGKMFLMVTLFLGAILITIHHSWNFFASIFLAS
jgi:hypothetical protein